MPVRIDKYHVLLVVSSEQIQGKCLPWFLRHFRGDALTPLGSNL